MKKKILVGYIMDGTSGGIDRYLLRFIEQVWAVSYTHLTLPTIRLV